MSRKDPVPAQEADAEPALPTRASHPLAHWLLFVVCTVLAVYGFFPLPGNQIGFPHFVLLLAYLYPLLLRWLRPRTGFGLGLVLLLLMVSVAESAGVFVYELQTTGLLFPHGFQNDVLLSPVVVLSFTIVELSAFTLYLAGWSMLTISLKIFARLAVPHPEADKEKSATPKPKPETTLAEKLEAAKAPEVHEKQ